ITKVVERKEIKAINTLEKEKLEHGVESVLDEDKEKSVEKDHGSTKGPILN
ncbi:hypothetical protein KI387_036333, partial [Taxus chinensis]